MVAATETLLRMAMNDPADAAEPLLETEDYILIVEAEPTFYRAAALAARAIAAQFALKADIEAGEVKIKLEQKFNHYMQLGRVYDIRAISGSVSGPRMTGVSIAAMDSVNQLEDRFPSLFKIGMFNNKGTEVEEEEEVESDG
jgi:hypothetical protein